MSELEHWVFYNLNRHYYVYSTASSFPGLGFSTSQGLFSLSLPHLNDKIKILHLNIAQLKINNNPKTHRNTCRINSRTMMFIYYIFLQYLARPFWCIPFLKRRNKYCVSDSGILVFWLWYLSIMLLTLEVLLWTRVSKPSKVPHHFLFNSLGIWWPLYLLAFIIHNNESVPTFLPKSRKSFTVRNLNLSIWLCFSGFQ